MSKKTPLEEYKILKEENPNTIVLFQIGNFYEVLFEDAKIVSEIVYDFKTKELAEEKVVEANIIEEETELDVPKIDLDNQSL